MAVVIKIDTLDVTKKYSATELAAAGLIPVKRGKKSKTVEFYTDKEIWSSVKQDRLNLQNYIITEKEKSPNNILGKDINIWKLCQRTQTYQHIDMFRHSVKTGKRYIGSTLEVEGFNRQGRRARLKNTSWEVFRYMHTGKKDGELVCAVTGESLEGKKRFNPRTGIFKEGLKHFEAHHYGNYNNISANKLSRRLNPSSILSDYDLKDPKNRHLVVDLMCTIIVSQDEHKLCHDTDRFSDLDYWIKNGATLPWCIRNEVNFNEFCKEMSLDLDYKTFLERNSLVWITANIHTFRDLDYTKLEDCEEYINRFKKTIPVIFGLTTGTSLVKSKYLNEIIEL